MAIDAKYGDINSRQRNKFVESPTRPGEPAVEVVFDTSVLGYVQLGPVNVSASSSLVIDTNLLTSFSRLEYVLNFKDSPVTVTKSLKLIVQNNAGDLKDTVTQRLGGPISVDVDVTDDAVDAFLTITNNESFDLTVTFLKALVP